jgi:hypothetical protein
VDVDAAVFAHVVRALDGALEDLDVDDPDVVTAVARLRDECTQAKEALSADTDVTIPVLVPGLTSEVRLTRGELEDMIRPALADSVGALRRAMRSAGVAADDLHSVLLVGGSSRIPLVAQLVAEELGRPVAVDADPKHAIALGASLLAGRVQATQVIPAVAADLPPAPPARPAAPAKAAAPVPAAAPAPATPPPAPEPVAKTAAKPPATAAPKPTAPRPTAPRPPTPKPTVPAAMPASPPAPQAGSGAAGRHVSRPPVVKARTQLLVPERQPGRPGAEVAWRRHRPVLVALTTVAALLVGSAAAIGWAGFDDTPPAKVPEVVTTKPSPAPGRDVRRSVPEETPAAPPAAAETRTREPVVAGENSVAPSEEPEPTDPEPTEEPPSPTVTEPEPTPTTDPPTTSVTPTDDDGTVETGEVDP